MLWDQLFQDGAAPYCPHWSIFQDMLFHREYEDWMTLDFEIIKRCDALIRMNGKSDGADREVDLATELGIPVFYNYPDVVVFIKEWAQDQVNLNASVSKILLRREAEGQEAPSKKDVPDCSLPVPASN